MREKIHRTTNLAGEMVCPECFLGVEKLESPEERFSLLLSGYCIDCVPDDVADELSESRCVYRGEIIPMDPYESLLGCMHRRCRRRCFDTNGSLHPEEIKSPGGVPLTRAYGG
jgi:hypothetical protein